MANAQAHDRPSARSPAEISWDVESVGCTTVRYIRSLAEALRSAAAGFDDQHASDRDIGRQVELCYAFAEAIKDMCDKACADLEGLSIELRAPETGGGDATRAG